MSLNCVARVCAGMCVLCGCGCVWVCVGVGVGVCGCGCGCVWVCVGVCMCDTMTDQFRMNIQLTSCCYDAHQEEHSWLFLLPRKLH